MSKRKPKDKQEEIDIYELYGQNISESPLGDYAKEIMLKYGINVSVFRACCAILDGLTPVKRRMLYTFYKAGATNDKRRVKANELLGPVQALHPHGELSINKTFSNEIKPWETNAPLFDTWGNTGSLTGEGCAATRYLETRLSKFAMECFFDDFDEDITEMVKSNTRRMTEPVYIPSKYPYFLLSTNTGIAWGNSISIPPFNLEEVFRLTQQLLKNPNMTNVYLYPDSPRGYDIIQSDNIVDICMGGKGTLKIQAVIKYGEEDGVKYLSVKGFPEETYMDNIMAEIGKLIKNKELPGVKTLADVSSLSNVEFRVILQNDVDPDYVTDMLYKKTRLRSFVSIDMNFAGRTKMQPMGMKDALLFWIENRIDTKQKFLLAKLSKHKERMHTLEVLIELLSPKHSDKVVEIVRQSSSSEECIAALMNEFGITSLQASIIDGFSINGLRKDNQARFIEELKKLEKEVEKVEEAVTSREKIKDIIWQELEEGIAKFGKPRACNVISSDALESPVHKYSVVVTKKYIKKMSVNTTVVGQIDSDDEVVGMWNDVPETATLRIFDSVGRCYAIGLDKISPTDAVSKGIPLSTFNVVGTPVRGFFDDKIKDFSEYSVVFFTKNGLIKRTNLEQYTRSRISLQSISLNKDDTVCFVTIINNNDYEGMEEHYPLIYTTNGNAISVNMVNVEMTDRLTKGTRYLAVSEEDAIQGICEVESGGSVLVITSKGYAKICETDDIFKTTKRRADMIKITTLNEGDSVFRIIPVTDKMKKIVCYLQSGEKVEVHIKDINTTTRISKGSKTIPVKRGDAIVRLKF